MQPFFQFYADHTSVVWLAAAIIIGFLVLICRMRLALIQRQKIEERLHRSETQLKLALEAANDGLWDWRIPEDVSYWSPRYYTMLGYEPDEIPATGETFKGLLHPEDKARVLVLLHRAVESGQPYQTEFRLRTKSGAWCWVFSRGKVVEWDEQGNARRIIGTHVDITDLKKSQQALKESKESYQMLTELSQDMISLHDANGVYLYASPACELLLGYTSDELVGHGAYEFFHPDDIAAINEHHQETVAGDRMPPITYRIRRKDGSYIWFETTNRFIRKQQSDEIEKIICVSRDISERKHIEYALRESEAKFREFVEGTGDLVTQVDHNGNLLYVNRQAEHI